METSKKKTIGAVAAIIVVLAAAKIIWFSSISPDRKLYQAVFLNSNQIFYGTLHRSYSRNPYLTDVYFLNAKGPTLDTKGKPTGQESFDVVKRGNEIHRPTDRIYLSEKNILYWENVGDDSLVAQAIRKEKESRTKEAAKAPAKKKD